MSSEKGAGSETADELFAKWKEQLEALWQETSRLFWSRKMYRTIVYMFQTNARLQKDGGDVWDWIRMLYGTEAVMGIRNDMDDQKNALSLVNVLRDLEEHAEVLTRERHKAHWGDFREVLSDDIASAFERAGGPPGPGTPADHLRPEAIAEERKALERITASSVKCANLVLAHRQKRDVTVPFKDIEEALGALYLCFRKYYGFITGGSLVTPTPIPQYDWLRPFRYAWITDDFNPPKDKWDF